MVFDESDCDRMERALLRAYRLFMHSGRLSPDNLSITKAALSRAIMHAMERGEREESRLAMYAVNTFTTYASDILARDLTYIGARRHASIQQSDADRTRLRSHRQAGSASSRGSKTA
jgi:hypothetical protein